MRILITCLFFMLPLSAAAATPTKILSSGEILSSFGNEGSTFARYYDVLYKGTIYRCITWFSDRSQTVTCSPLKEK